jgi:hypothetical protein
VFMFILLPVILMLLTALALLILRWLRPRFKFPWIIAAGGALLALASVFLWQIHFPSSIFLPSSQLVPVISYVPSWLADGISWPYALALASLAAAVIWTSVVRDEAGSMPWIGTLILSALGILAVASENPLTLILAWTAIDLFELITMLWSAEDENQIEGVIIAFAARVAGTGLVLWANLVSTASGTSLSFHSIPESTGIYLLLAASLRLGVLPLHLPYRKDNVGRRGFGTALRLVSAAASLVLLARIPANALNLTLTPYLLIPVVITAIYAGWMWLRSSDEIQGRPFWILGVAALAVAESLRGNPTGSAGWGVALILCGGTLFLFSARQRNMLWLPFLGLWALSTLPFSLNSSSWQTGNLNSSLFVIPFLPAKALLLAGFFHHASQQGETDLTSQEIWVKAIYPGGLLFLMVIAILLGFWGWPGALTVGRWWWGIVTILLAISFILLAPRVHIRLHPGNVSTQWTRIFRIEWLYRVLTAIYNFLLRISDIMTTAFEGEGGLLWSFLLLVLIFSILSTSIR